LNTYKLGFKQIKEDANFGLVFNGPQAIYKHSWIHSKKNTIFIMENEIGICIPFSKGIPALDVYLKPAELSWLFLNKGINNLAVGPMVKLEYNYTLYPQLQSAFDYWFTNLSLGMNARYTFNIAGKPAIASLKTSLCGFTSRQPEYRNPYFYDIGFNHALNHLNSDFEFSTVSKYSTSNFELSWKPKPESLFSLAYSFNFAGYFEAPELLIVHHSINVVFNPKRK
jgi:hypothetical protein